MCAYRCVMREEEGRRKEERGREKRNLCVCVSVFVGSMRKRVRACVST